MAGQSPPPVEILVHVAAPSRAADDGLYRQLAHAYLAFEPVTRTTLVEAPVASSSSPVPEQRAVFVAPDSQDLSFQSALDNRFSPRLRPTPAPPAPVPSQFIESRASSFCAPASQVSDSYPLPDAAVFSATPTRVLQRYLSKDSHGSAGTTTSGTPSPPSRPGAEVIDVPSSLPVPSRQHEPPPPPHHASPAGHVVPATPVAALAPPPRSKRVAEEPATSALLDVTHISSSFVSHQTASSPSRAESEPPPLPPPRKRPRTAGGVDGDSLALVRSTSDAGPVMSMTDFAEADNDALEIRPPSPPAGTAHVDPASLVSDKLAKLAQDLSSRYRPEPARRALEPLERGYWLLDWSGWPPQTRRETWIFLKNYLRSGLAGWGVWCRRGSAAPELERCNAWIRLYCWACVAKHTYLLLYLASGRHVKTTGAAWFGADGRVALEVAASGARRP